MTPLTGRSNALRRHLDIAHDARTIHGDPYDDARTSAFG